MDLYQSTVKHLLALPAIQAWPELQVILAHTASGRPKSWELPVQACEAVGGTLEQAIPVVAAIACAQISIILLDDMLDEDPRGEYRRVGYAKTANYAAALQAAALEALCLDETRATLKQISSLRSLNQMIITTALGQHMDVQTFADEHDYWAVVENKSAPFFGTAFYMGAFAGGASHKMAMGLEQLGRLYGEMIQIHDDLNDTLAVPANSDWVQGRSPLPILFGKLVHHPARTRFIELCSDILAPGALAEAQGILVQCGAISYCVYQLLHRYHSAQTVLANIALKKREIMDARLEKMIAPARDLFQSVGMELTASVMLADLV